MQIKFNNSFFHKIFDLHERFYVSCRRKLNIMDHKYLLSPYLSEYFSKVHSHYTNVLGQTYSAQLIFSCEILFTIKYQSEVLSDQYLLSHHFSVWKWYHTILLGFLIPHTFRFFTQLRDWIWASQQTQQTQTWEQKPQNPKTQTGTIFSPSNEQPTPSLQSKLGCSFEMARDDPSAILKTPTKSRPSSM